jgi:hypothetical protein
MALLGRFHTDCRASYADLRPGWTAGQRKNVSTPPWWEHAPWWCAAYENVPSRHSAVAPAGWAGALGARWTGRCGTGRRDAAWCTGALLGGGGVLGRAAGTVSVGVAFGVLSGVTGALSQVLGSAAPPPLSSGTGPHAVRRKHATSPVTNVLPRITVTPFID